MSVANLRQVCSALVAYKTRDSFPSQSNVDVTCKLNCKRKEHTVYLVSSLTSFSYLSALSQFLLCKSPSVEAVSMHRCWLLGVCVTSLSLYLCILIARTHVQWSIFFYGLLYLNQGFFFSFPQLFINIFFFPYMSIAKEPRMLILQKGVRQCFKETREKEKDWKEEFQMLCWRAPFIWVVYLSFAS